MENITNELNMKSGMVVVAHADDAEYGCSGTVAKLVNSGCEMVVSAQRSRTEWSLSEDSDFRCIGMFLDFLPACCRHPQVNM